MKSPTDGISGGKTLSIFCRNHRMSNVKPNPMVLPEELIVEILSRVSSVKSLIRFRCVCKSWQLLLRDPSFVRLHLNRSSIKNETNLIYSFDPNSSPAHLLSVHCAESFKELYRLTFKPHVRRPLSIVGCCNGLVCLSRESEIRYYSSIYLCNPAIREFKKLPMSEFLKPKDAIVRCVALGFGIDPSIDGDYQVVKIIYLCGDSEKTSNIEAWTEVEIYKLRTNSWESLGNIAPSAPIFTSSSGVFVDGSIYWISESRFAMTVLDLRCKVFREIALPCYFHPSSNMGLLRGSICYLSDGSERRLELYVMKENGVSWTEEKRVLEGLNWHLCPAGFGNDGKLLVLGLMPRRLVWYDIERQNVKDLFLELSSQLQLVPYVESLVSIISAHDQHASEGVNTAVIAKMTEQGEEVANHLKKQRLS